MLLDSQLIFLGLIELGLVLYYPTFAMTFASDNHIGKKQIVAVLIVVAQSRSDV